MEILGLNMEILGLNISDWLILLLALAGLFYMQHKVVNNWPLPLHDVITSLAVTPHTGHIVLCHGWAAGDRPRVEMATTRGQYLTLNPLTPPPDLKPHSVSVHPTTGDLIMACRLESGDDKGRRFVVYYRYADWGLLSWPHHKRMEIGGEWETFPYVVWKTESLAVAGLQDKAGSWWLVTLNVNRQEEVSRVNSGCGRIVDLSVAPEGDALYVCDLNNEQIAVFKETTKSHSFSVSHPMTVCAISGGTVLVSYRVENDNAKTHSVGMWNQDGTHIRDIVTNLPANNWRVGGVSEARKELVVSDGWKFVKKYDVSEYL